MLTKLQYRLKKFLFPADVRHEVALVQKRALWISLAIILQSLNEIGHDWFVSGFGFVGPIIPFLLYFFSLVALWFAFNDWFVWDRFKVAGNVGRMVILLLLVVFGFRGIYELGRGVAQSVQQPPQYWNDGASLSINAAILLLEGRNPYTDSHFVEVVERFQIQPSWTTPLRAGQFEGRLEYPTQTELEQVFKRALASGQAAEFEDKVSYPALSFLPFVPFALIKHYNVFPFYVVSYLVFVWCAWKFVDPQLRMWALLLGLANIPMWGAAVGGNLDVLCFLFILLAWLVGQKRWASALCLGLAVATKQVAWFFAPFYLIWVWRTVGFKEACYRGLIVGGTALLINLPFIVWNPQAWWVGVLVPMIDPMFPAGVGLINLSTIHVLPYFPTLVYSVLEFVVLLAGLLSYWRISPRKPEAVMWLAVIPLFFAWRSLPSYFACAAYGLFVLMAARSGFMGHSRT